MAAYVGLDFPRCRSVVDRVAIAIFLGSIFSYVLEYVCILTCYVCVYI